MDKSIFDKYIAEMKAMQALAMPNNEEMNTPALEPLGEINATDMSGSGSLVVIVTAVRGLYPVRGAKVTVFTGSGQDENKITEVFTNESGKTVPIPLPAPSSDFTEAPNPDERPFAYYNIRTEADGFIESINYNVAVFDKVTSLQTVSLYPVASAPNGTRPIIINEASNYEL